MIYVSKLFISFALDMLLRDLEESGIKGDRTSDIPLLRKPGIMRSEDTKMVKS